MCYDRVSDVVENGGCFASKILTHNRMHWHWSKIANLKANMPRIQNMYNMYRAKVDRLAGKIIFYWKGPENPLFRGDTIQVMSLWRELEAKPVTSGQLLEHPWNVWDITLQMSYVEAWWHQNWVHSRPILCRGGGDAEISENLCFFIKRSVAPNLQIETFLGPAPTDSPRTQLSEYL